MFILCSFVQNVCLALVFANFYSGVSRGRGFYETKCNQIRQQFTLLHLFTSSCKLIKLNYNIFIEQDPVRSNALKSKQKSWSLLHGRRHGHFNSQLRHQLSQWSSQRRAHALRLGFHQILQQIHVNVNVIRSIAGAPFFSPLKRLGQ